MIKFKKFLLYGNIVCLPLNLFWVMVYASVHLPLSSFFLPIISGIVNIIAIHLLREELRAEKDGK